MQWQLCKLFCNLIRGSPKRLAIFKTIQDENKTMSCSSLKPLCPTRWTCRAKVVQSVTENYESLVKAIQVIIEEEGYSEGVKLALGLLRNMFDFSVFNGLHMSKEIFSATELLAAGLQKNKMSAGEAVQCKVS